jgi:type 1 fimbria pilin
MLTYSSASHAFYCSNGSQSVDWQTGGTITTTINALSLSKNTLDTLLTNMNAYAYCNGSPKSGYEDALRTQSITLSSELTKLGFTAYIKSFGGPATQSPPGQVCIWPDANCSLTGETDKTKPINAQIGITRNTGSGDWHAGANISPGTEIARMVTQMRYYGGAWGREITWVFVLKNEMVIPAYTCNITQYDKSVTLPNVSRTALQSHGNGRYPDVKKEFQFALNCDASTAVSVTFEGDVLSGTDNVLKNAYSGNDNIGVQMLFSDNTPVKLETKYPVISSAQENEILKLNAYYYYKGGDVGAGPIKANTTFMFDYQ